MLQNSFILLFALKMNSYSLFETLLFSFSVMYVHEKHSEAVAIKSMMRFLTMILF